MAGEIKILKKIFASMQEESRRNPGQECCGLLAGRDGVITEIFPAANALGSATQFEIAPAELFRIFRAIRAEGLDHLGIYHSHPRGPATPSATDIAQAFYPEAAYFVISPSADEGFIVNAFCIREGGVEELTVKVYS